MCQKRADIHKCYIMYTVSLHSLICFSPETANTLSIWLIAQSSFEIFIPTLIFPISNFNIYNNGISYLVTTTAIQIRHFSSMYIYIYISV